MLKSPCRGFALRLSSCVRLSVCLCVASSVNVIFCSALGSLWLKSRIRFGFVSFASFNFHFRIFEFVNENFRLKFMELKSVSHLMSGWVNWPMLTCGDNNHYPMRQLVGWCGVQSKRDRITAKSLSTSHRSTIQLASSNDSVIIASVETVNQASSNGHSTEQFCKKLHLNWQCNAKNEENSRFIRERESTTWIFKDC